MWDPSSLKRLVCRNLVFILIISYISFTMMILLNLLVGDAPNFELSQNPSAPIWSAGSYQELIPTYRHHSNRSSYRRLFLPQGNVLLNPPDNKTHFRFSKLFSHFLEPTPLEKPQLADNHFGTFYSMHSDVFVYSTFLDDRKEDTYIRVLTLSSQSSSKTSIFCHFSGDFFNLSRKGERYELCENHNRKFGGYIYSCQVPQFLDQPIPTRVIISWGQSGRKVTVPLLRVMPPAHKLEFLNSYVEEDNNSDSVINTNNRQKRNININARVEKQIPRHSFAICVPPLFGDVSPHRLIEFIELSLLLGAQHIFFYRYHISDDIFRVLSYYPDVVTLLPWTLPSSVTPDRVWYYGQLLAHNDCLYRAMPKFDLIAFNDIDEFIVPHHNTSQAWNEVFPNLLTNRTCGWSFLSAFYDPGIDDMRNPNPITPKLTARSGTFSKIRTKVMICPWRVFEIGIHHVSKQNRELWTVQEMNTSTAFLHHYRRCVANYDMSCRKYVRDTIIEERFGDALRARVTKTIDSIS